MSVQILHFQLFAIAPPFGQSVSNLMACWHDPVPWRQISQLLIIGSMGCYRLQEQNKQQ